MGMMYDEDDEEKFNTCDVVDQHCILPPGANRAGGYRSLRTECFVCGMPVCRACSSIRQYFKQYGKVRMCNRCQEDWDGDNHRVMARIYHQAGYKGSPPKSLLDARMRHPSNPKLLQKFHELARRP